MGILKRALQPLAQRASSGGGFHPSRWPREDSDLQKWLIHGGQYWPNTHSGKDVNEENALEATAVWSAVMQLSQSVAALPLHLYQRLDRGKKRAINHPLYKIMHLKPNPEMASMNFREAGMCQILRYGFWCAEKELDQTGRVIALWPLLSKDITRTRMLGELTYVVHVPNGPDRILHRDRVLEIVGFSSNGLAPYNPIKTNRESIALGLAIEEYGSTFFGNGALPAAVLQHPESLSPEAADRLRESWDKIHKGLDKSHRIAILEEGMELKEFSIDPEKAQTLETRQFQIEEVARIFNMPVHMLKDLRRSTNNNIEFQGLEFVKYTLHPWLVRFEQNYTIQLLSDKEQKKYFFEHLVDALLRGDTKVRHEAYKSGIQSGYYSPNDVREMENMNSIGEKGDIYLVPLNMVPIDQIGMEEESSESNPTEPPEGEDFEDLIKTESKEKREKTEKKQDILEKRKKNLLKSMNKTIESYRKIIKKSAQTVINKETLAVKKAAKKNLSERGVSGFGTWMDNFYKEHKKYVYDTLNPVLRSYQELILKEANSILDIEIGAGDLENFFDDTVKNYVYRHIRSSNGQLTKIVQDIPVEELHDAVIARMDEWYEKRAKKIAADESVRFANSVSRETWRQGGYKKIKWQTQGKNCPFCDALSGRTVGIQETFFDDDDVLYVNSDTGKFNIYNPTTKKYKEKQFSGKKSDQNVQALKMRRLKYHPPIHRGCDCRILPE